MDTANKTLAETQVDLKLTAAGSGQLMSVNIPEPLPVLLDAVFQDEGIGWTPGQLFLSAISSSFVATLRSLTRYSDVKDLYCSIVAKGNSAGARYELESLTLSISMNAESVEAMLELQEAIEMAKQQCFLLKLLNFAVDLHSQIRRIPGD